MLKRPLQYDEAIITSLIRYGDADCIVRLFCRRHGRMTAFVKNGLKPSKSRGSVIQAPARASIGISMKPGIELVRLSVVDIAAQSYALSANLRSFGFACYLTELIEIFLAEHEQNETLFALLDEAYQLLAQQLSLPVLLRAFELKLLEQCGYLPDLHNIEGVIAAFDPIEGIFLGQEHTGCVPFNEEARSLALHLLRAPLANLDQPDMDILRMLSRVFASRLRHIHPSPLKSVAFLKSIGV